MDDFLVKPAKLKEDGKVWLQWSEQVTDVANAVPTIGPEMTMLDFSMLPGAQGVRQAYATVSETFTTGLNEGAEQFRGVSEKLDKVAEIYEDVEQSLVDAISASDDG